MIVTSEELKKMHNIPKDEEICFLDVEKRLEYHWETIRSLKGSSANVILRCGDYIIPTFNPEDPDRSMKWLDESVGR